MEFLDDVIHPGLINTLINKILTDNDSSATTKIALETLQTNLNAVGGVIYFADDDFKFLCTYSFTKKNRIVDALADIADLYDKFHFPISDETSLISRCFIQDKVLYSQDLSDFYYPVLPKYRVRMIQRFLRVGCAICIPIHVGTEKKGVMFIAFQRNEVLDREISLLSIYADLVGIAIYKSQQIEDLEEKYLKEKLTTAMLSHELKTPISIAHSSMQYLKTHGEQFREHVQEHKKLGESLKDMELSINRLNYVCNSIFTLMDTENRDNSSVHQFDLNRQLEQVINTYDQKARKKGLDFRCEMENSTQRVYGGGAQLEQIVTILLDNAIKYSDKGTVRLRIKADDNRIKCEVTDNGPGIDIKTRAKIFEKYFRHREKKNRNLVKVEGLGLGLYIAKKISDRISGKISVTDNPEGEGSLFEVEIPVYNDLPENSQRI